LRERTEDILLLAEFFVTQHCKKHKRRLLKINRRAEALLKNYNWPGNVREFNNLMLEIDRVTLYRKMKKYGLKDNDLMS